MRSPRPPSTSGARATSRSTTPASCACVRPRTTSASLSLQDVVEELRRRGFRSPFLIRFPQILKHRVGRLHDAFAAAIKEFDYPKHYQGVLPVKVNQQRVVVEALVEESGKHRYGLEVGSKGELALALTMTLHPEAFVICNGFKDRDYIELALRALRAGTRILLISETIHEVREVVAVAREVGIQPLIGFRARLHAEGVGKWQDSGGSHAKFGLSTTELLEALAFLRRAGPDELGHLRALPHRIAGERHPRDEGGREGGDAPLLPPEAPRAVALDARPRRRPRRRL